MIVVRNVFRLKFGKSKEAGDLWKQALPIAAKAGMNTAGVRLLTDLAGEPYYTLVFESTHESLAEWEQTSLKLRSDAQWKEIYAKIIPLTEEGKREIYSVL